MKKWAVPAYIRGFDSFKPPMSRFCLWKAALFTRFWSFHLPFLAWFKRFWSRIFSQGDLIYEVLISGKTIYILYIMYIRGFDLASDTQTGYYIRGFDLQHHKIRRLYARGFDLSDSVAQGADSRGLHLSPTRGTLKTRSKPRKWGDTGEAGDRHQMWFTFIKKQQDVGNQFGRFLRKTLIFDGKEAGKTGLLRIRGVEIYKKQWKVIMLYRVYR